MPPPKRTKLAQTQSSRVANRTTPSVASNDHRTESQTSSVRATSNSDDSEGIITKIPQEGKQRGVAQQETTMSGALAVEDVGTAPLRPLRGRKRAALLRIAREDDRGARAIEALRARLEAEERAKREQAESAGNAEGSISRPGPAVSAVDAAPVAKVAEASIDRAPPRRESSVLADFKRRPRQPSLLQMVQAQQKAVKDVESDPEEDSLNDFLPDDESTPLARTKLLPDKQQSTPSAAEPSVQHSSGSRKRKRSSRESVIQVPASQIAPNEPSTPPAPPESDPCDIPADVDAEQPSLPVIRSTQLSSQLDRSVIAQPENRSPTLGSERKKSGTRSKNSKRGRPQTQSRPKANASLAAPRDSSPPASPMSSTSSYTSPGSDIELSEDQDELSFHKPPKAKKRIPAIAPKSKPGKVVAKPPQGKASATYGKKKVIEVSENEQRSETSSVLRQEDGVENEERKKGDMYGRQRSAALKGEMRRLAQKFKEVDDWTLEIEDVTPHSGSSQMVDAR